LGALNKFSVARSSWKKLKKMLETLLVHIFTVSILTFLLGFRECYVENSFDVRIPAEGHESPQREEFGTC
jgi:hypothetical protein